ncbi:four helix bundle protein [Mangrovibacterium marinum]|uniref:Four helix bundle protein n=1 Tax=Mangrovibacterium marinum TaxID=1639118 RepID=A0A2T5BZ90_9BACT|nr:four helix bundle protein [Mangrovibacterium marinum]PTN07572.1 four helix bundle protein [Mangrovibacterium marinum]
MKLEDLQVYQISMELADEVHALVMQWDNFYRFSTGQQLLEAADSISANISEGFGRFYYKDHKNFLYFSRGSLFETKTWLTKADRRKLIDEETFQTLMKSYDTLGIKLNNYINSIGPKGN